MQKKSPANDLSPTAQNGLNPNEGAVLPKSFLRQQYLSGKDFNNHPITNPVQIEKGFILNENTKLAVIRESNDVGERYLLEEIRAGFSERIFVEIAKPQFDELWEQTRGLQVKKTEYETTIESEGVGEIPAIVSKYHGELEGLNIVEVEFPSLLHNFSFDPEKYNLRDISKHREYEESSLVLSGLPRHFSSEENKYPSHIPQFKLREGLHSIWLKICQMKLRSHKDRPLIISIAGGSNSGKTQVITDSIEKSGYRNIITLSLDNYYRGNTWMEEQRKNGIIINYDQPEALNLELLRKHLEMLRNGQAVEMPFYDFTTSEPHPTKTIRIDPNVFEPKTTLTENQKEGRSEKVEVILLEGLFSLNETLLKESDLKVFVSSDSRTRLIRRLIRDCLERGRSPESVLKAFSEVVNPMHEKYVEPSSSSADMIIFNDLIPELESENSGLHEVQLKFKASGINREELEKLGAVHVETVNQSDVYHDPKDRNLMESQEMIRLRTQTTEGSKKENKYFTYKGPKIFMNGYTTRPIFECEVPSSFNNVFSENYGFEIKTIKKTRQLFKLDGILFTLDSVKKIVCGKEVDLGTFIEIRSVESIPSKNSVGNSALNERVSTCEKELMLDLATKLGINNRELFNESYFEM